MILEQHTRRRSQKSKQFHGQQLLYSPKLCNLNINDVWTYGRTDFLNLLKRGRTNGSSCCAANLFASSFYVHIIHIIKKVGIRVYNGKYL